MAFISCRTCRHHDYIKINGIERYYCSMLYGKYCFSNEYQYHEPIKEKITLINFIEEDEFKV